jgi:hypothetical protein
MRDELMLKTWHINVKAFKGGVQISALVDLAQCVIKAGEVAKHVDNVVSAETE